MKESELKFDREKHLIYSKAVKKIIQDQLCADYPPEQAAQLWEETQKRYVRILEDMPFMGGKKNFQSGSVYDCAALFAYAQAVPDRPSVETFAAMNNALFLPAAGRAGFANLNRPLFSKAAGFIWKTLAKQNRKHREDWPGNYIMDMQDAPEGNRYVFLRCPIAELAKRLDMVDLMPAMCNPDYPMLAGMRGGLIRTTTCAFGDFCDYWIVGDQSETLKKHPQKVNEAGYIVNE